MSDTLYMGAYTDGRTTSGQYRYEGGTRLSTGEGTAPALQDEERRVIDWLGSDEARFFEGLWVALQDDHTVVGAAASPRDLRAELISRADVTVVYVIPEGTVLGG